MKLLKLNYESWQKNLFVNTKHSEDEVIQNSIIYNIVEKRISSQAEMNNLY